jgi:hypothetical protein
MKGNAMAKTSYSGEMVRNNRKVILTIPGAEMAEAVMGCGSTTGRDTDKVAKFGIELTEVESSDIKIPVHTYILTPKTSDLPLRMGRRSKCKNQRDKEVLNLVDRGN